MNRERRHELEENELAKFFSRAGEDFAPYLKFIAAGLVVGVLGWATWAYVSGSSLAGNEKAWFELEQALSERKMEFVPGVGFDVNISNSTEALATVAQDHGTSVVGRWALVHLGQSRLTEGTNLLFTDRKAGQALIEQSIENLQSALDKAGSNEEDLKELATYRLAQAQESLLKLDEAAELYQKVVDTWPNGTFHEVAASDIRRLNFQDDVDWYAWFADQEIAAPRTTDPGNPGSFPSSEPSGFPGSSDPHSGITLPDTNLTEGLNLGGDDEEDEEPAGDINLLDLGDPSEGSSTPETPGEEPASDAPASDEPASEESPE